MFHPDKRINVAIRIRPLLDHERYDPESTRKISDDSISVFLDDVYGNPTHHEFTYDTIFDESDTQKDVYEESVREIVDHSLAGCNSTIFAYGQTGSGKTYTILGETSSRAVGRGAGIFLRIFEDLLWYRDVVKDSNHIIFGLSAVELYIEDVLDLFNNKKSVKIREVGDETLLPDVRCVIIDNMAQAHQYYAQATSQRTVAATQINDVSSRSHAVFFIDVFSIPVEDESAPAPRIEQLFADDAAVQLPGMIRSRISLVDLAGSECVKKAGVEGVQLIEANAIHKSLTSLHMVIHALWVQSPHIPFRDSKLTRLLKSCFTDRTGRVLLIGQVAPGRPSAGESLGTLRFCDNVKTLKFAGTTPFIDPKEQDIFTRVVRTYDELCADIRIVEVLHYYQLQYPRKYARLKKVKRIESAIATLAQQYKKKSAEEQAEREQRELREMQVEARQHAESIRVSGSKKAAERSTEVELLMTENARLLAQQNVDAEMQERDVQEKLHDTKTVKRKRLDLEEKLEKYNARLEKYKARQRHTEEQFAAYVKKSRTPQDIQEDELWEEFNGDWTVSEANHQIVELFFREWTKINVVHSEYASVTGYLDILFDEVTILRDRFSTAEIGGTVSDIIEFAIDRSVDIAEGRIDARDSFSWFDITQAGQARRIRNPATLRCPLNVIPDPRFAFPRSCEGSKHTKLSDDDQVSATIPAAPRIKSPSPAAIPKGSSPQAGSSQLTMPFEAHEADKLYVMKIYDSPTLLQDVVKFLGAPTVMTKHGRHGNPHFRKFWVAPAVQGGRDLVWTDPEAGAKAELTGVSISEIRAIVLGPFSKVFERSNIPANSKEFFLSFSVVIKDASRTVDITSDTLVNFEAWVLGLSSLAQVTPQWGGSLDVSRDPACWNLARKERQLCERHCIVPSLFLKIKEQVKLVRDEVSMHMRLFRNPEQAYDSLGGIHAPQINDTGAVLLTKGELRYYAGQHDVDIFRTCAMWENFAEEKLVFDPNYTPATYSNVK